MGACQSRQLWKYDLKDEKYLWTPKSIRRQDPNNYSDTETRTLSKYNSIQQNTAAQNTAAQNTAAQNTSVQNTAVQKTAVQNTAAQFAAVLGTSLENTAVQNTAKLNSVQSWILYKIQNYFSLQRVQLHVMAEVYSSKKEKSAEQERCSFTTLGWHQQFSTPLHQMLCQCQFLAIILNQLLVWHVWLMMGNMICYLHLN